MIRQAIIATLCYIALIIGACALAAIYAYAQQQDEHDARAAREHSAKQARIAAQGDKWHLLDAAGRQMVSYERIGK